MFTGIPHMPIRTALVGVVLLLLGCTSSDVDQWVLVEVPPQVASIRAGTLRVSLFRYDPYLMDAPATRVDRAVLAFSHRIGQRTTVRARVQGSGSGGERFYLTVTGCAETPDGQTAVLWDGLAVEMPTYVRMRPLEPPLFSCDVADRD